MPRDEYRCRTCGGQGVVTDGRDERGRPRDKVCPNCNGDGRV